MNKAKILNYILGIMMFFLILKFSDINISDNEKVQLQNMDKLKNNSTIETIHNRKSVRNFIDKKVVSTKNLVELVRAGMAAPTAVNKQPWAFIIINDRQKLDALGDTLPYAKMLFTASAAIVVCGDTNKALTGVNKEYWIQDCSAATQNILLATESLGLGATWTSTFPYKERMDPVIKELNLPKHLIPLNIIPIGYPIGKDKAKDKWKQKNVYINTYNTPLTGYAESRVKDTLK